jgi:hypothetical protein
LLAIEASEPRIGQEVIAADSALETARYVLKGKIADAVKSSPGVMKLLFDYETAQKSLAGMRRVLQLISGKNGLPDSARHWYAERHWPVDMALEQKWRAAIDALESDAHAALPE